METQTNFMQVVEQTDEEKLTMYMKLSKKELAKMLIEANKQLARNLLPIYSEPVKYERWPNYPDFYPGNPFPNYTITCSTNNTGSGYELRRKIPQFETDPTKINVRLSCYQQK